MIQGLLVLFIAVAAFLVGLVVGGNFMYYMAAKKIDESDLDYETKSKIFRILNI